MASLADAKVEHCVSFILKQFSHFNASHASLPDPPPFFIGVNGVQGIGKTTLVSALASELQASPQCLQTLVVSIDDLYLTREAQQALASSRSGNPFLQHRGVPGTHDIPLATALFAALQSGLPCTIPRYDKSKYNGRGDRADPQTWEKVNQQSQKKLRIVIFEGWCVGFRALSSQEVEARWTAAQSSPREDSDGLTLAKHKLEDLLLINEYLRSYDAMTEALDAFIHLDAKETRYVYQWRLQQEEALRREKGLGMTDSEVVAFVDGYYPFYVLCIGDLRRGCFSDHEKHGKSKRQLRLVVNQERQVEQVERI